MFSALWLLGLAAPAAWAWDPEKFPDGSDLTHFVSRPDIKAPRLNVTKHIPEAISEGYLFFSPYSELMDQPQTPRREHIPCQNGAHIYDGDGELVWSGACKYRNRNIHDFKAVKVDGEYRLTMFVSPGNVQRGVTAADAKESHVILDNRYEELQRPRAGLYAGANFHEFQILPDGQHALMTRDYLKSQDSVLHNQSSIPVWSTGFRDVNLATGQGRFDWTPIDGGVDIDESFDMNGLNHTTKEAPWDFFHINSVDRDEDGDYLISARHTFTVYKISGKDGSIMWRLGGRDNDFKMLDGLEFHWQHDARFRSKNETHTIISLFDNHGDDAGRNPDIPNKESSAIFIVLDTASKPMTAQLIRRIERPDGNKSPKCGSAQMIGESWDNSSVFVGWAVPAYASEHDSQNRLVMEAQFASTRFNSYRAYKYEFVGNPVEPPAFKVLPISFGESSVASAFYASWNGATEVKSWGFHGSNSKDGPFKLIKVVPRQGFETSFVAAETYQYSYAEALDSKGKALNRSATYNATWAKNVKVTDETLAAPPKSAPSGFPATQEAPEQVTHTMWVTQTVSAAAAAVTVTYVPEHEKDSQKSVEQPASQQQQQQTSKSQRIPELSTSEMFSVFCVSAFSLFGMFITLRRVLYMFARWKRGHGYSVPLSREPSYSDSAEKL